MRELILALCLLVAPVGVWLTTRDGMEELRLAGGPAAPPRLSPEAEAGRLAFDAACAECHGALAEGTQRGPPLLHPDYLPGMRSDADFARAVREGVRAWRWWYGDMPPIEGVSGRRLERIIRFVREMQRARGISPPGDGPARHAAR